MTPMVRRMLGAARLDAGVYEEVEADTRLTTQAVAVVLLASLAGGLGAGWPRWPIMALGAVFTLSGWVVWALVTWWIGTRLLPEPQTRSNIGELLRTIGFAASPGVLRVLGVVPLLRGPVYLAATIWMLVATVVAVRQALDYRSTLRAVLVCGIGWLIQVVFLAFALAFLVGTSGPAF